VKTKALLAAKSSPVRWGSQMCLSVRWQSIFRFCSKFSYLSGFLRLCTTVGGWKCWGVRSGEVITRDEFAASEIGSFPESTPIFLTPCCALVFYFSVIFSFNLLLCFCLPCVWVGKLFGWFWSCVGFLRDQPMCLTTKRWLFQINLISYIRVIKPKTMFRVFFCFR